MLGWHIFISRQALAKSPDNPEGTESTLASWEAGLGGLDWLDALVKEGRAVYLGGDGYPVRYTATAAGVVSKLSAGPPRHEGPLVFGEDYVMAGGWVGDVRVDQSRLAECSPDEELLIEAWDLS